MRTMWVLLWKEWRQGWKLLALAIVLSGVIVSAFGWTDRHPIEVQVAAWVLIAGVFGAPLFAGEKEARSFEFLAVQPVRPITVWLAKVLSGLLLLAVFMAATFGIAAAWAVHKRLPLLPTKMLNLPVLMNLITNSVEPTSRHFVYGLPVAAYAGSVFASTALRKSLEAFLLSLFLSYLLCGVAPDWAADVFHTDVSMFLLAAEIGFFLAPSAVLFTWRGERIGRRAVRAAAAALSGVIVGAAVMGIGCAYLEVPDHLLRGDYHIGLVSASPDGRHVAAEVRVSGRQRLWVVPTDGARSWMAPGWVADVSYDTPFSSPWSEDGSRLAYRERLWSLRLGRHLGRARILDVRSGKCQTILKDLQSVEDISLLRGTGQLLATDWEWGIFVQAQGRPPYSVLRRFGLLKKLSGVSSPHLAPWVAILLPEDPWKERLLNPVTMKTLVSPDLPTQTLGISPSGRDLIWWETPSKGDVMARIWRRDMESKEDRILFEWKGRGAKTDGVERNQPGGFEGALFSPDGNVVLVWWSGVCNGGSARFGALCDLTGKTPPRSLKGSLLWWREAFSPDGRWFAHLPPVAGPDGKERSNKLCLIDLKSGKETVAADKANGYHLPVHWSPDSRRLAWILEERQGESKYVHKVFVLNLEAMQEQECPTKGLPLARWVGNERLLLFDTNGKTLSVINADGTGLRRIFP